MRGRMKTPMLAALLSLLLLLTACGASPQPAPASPGTPSSSPSSPPPAAPKQAVLKIGVLGPMSGGAAVWGIAMKRTADMFAEKVNGQGGLAVGDTRYQIKIVSYDTKGEAAESATVANKLIYDDGVKYILGNAIGATCSAVQGITDPQKVLFSFVCWGDNLGPKHPYSFRSYAGPYEAALPLYNWIKQKHPEVKKVAIISPNDQSGQETANAVEKTAQQMGMQVVAKESFQRNSQDFNSLLARILAAKPDMIDLAASPPGEGGLILKQAYEMGYRGAKAWTASSDTTPVVKIASVEATNGIWNVLSWDLTSPPSNPKLQEWAKAYKQKYNEDAVVIAASNYIAYEVFAQAMQKAGSVEPDAVIKVVEAQPKWDTILGPVLVGGKDMYQLNRQFLYPLIVSELKDGKPVALEQANPPGL